jgi:hypothetical protein
MLVPAFLSALVKEKPSRKDIDDIQDILDRANSMQFGDKWNKIIEIEEQVGLRDPRTHEPYRPDPARPFFKSWEVRSIYFKKLEQFVAARDAAYARLKASPMLEEYLDALSGHRRNQKEASELYVQAIKEIIDLYGLTRLGASGTIVNGPPKPKTSLHVPSYEGETAVWQPVVAQDLPKKTYGQTWPDGRVELGLASFQYVGKLAYTLWHESRHFQDFLTPREKLDLVNEPASEVRVREEGLRYRGSIFGITKEDRDNEDLYIAAERRRAETWKMSLFKMRLRMGDPYSAKWREGLPGANSYGVVGDPEVTRKLAEIQRGADDLKVGLEREAQRRRAERIPPVAMPPGMPYVPPPVATPPGMPLVPLPERPGVEPPIVRVGTNLWALASAACQDPDALTSEQTRGWLVGFPDGRDWGRYEAKSCADELYNELMQINMSRGSLTQDRLRARARELKRKYEAPQQPYPDPGPGDRNRGPIDPRPPRPAPDPWRGG